MSCVASTKLSATIVNASRRCRKKGKSGNSHWLVEWESNVILVQCSIRGRVSDCDRSASETGHQFLDIADPLCCSSRLARAVTIPELQILNRAELGNRLTI